MSVTSVKVVSVSGVSDLMLAELGAMMQVVCKIPLLARALGR